MRQLSIEGKKTNLNLRTLGNANSKTESYIASLELFDLPDENHVSLKTVFSAPELPVTTRNRASQQDMKQWPLSNNIQLAQIDAGVGLLIGSDAREVLEPKDIRRSRDGGQYARRTIHMYLARSSMVHLGNQEQLRTLQTTYINNEDVNLDEHFRNYCMLACNIEFNDINKSNVPRSTSLEYYEQFSQIRELALRNRVALEAISTRHAE